MKKTIKPMLMLLLMSVSFFVKGQTCPTTPFDNAQYINAGTATGTLDNCLGPIIFNDPATNSNEFGLLPFYRDRIAVGDPNGQTGASSNLFYLSIIPYRPFIKSMLTSYGGTVTGQQGSRSAIQSMIEQNGLGVATGGLSEASYQSSGIIQSFGAHGDFFFNPLQFNQNDSRAMYTAGGYFRNVSLIPDNNVGLTTTTFNHLHGGTIGHLQLGEGVNGFGAVIGLDQTAQSTGFVNGGTPANPTGNYAGLFYGRGFFSNRVGIGQGTPTNNPLNPTNMLHVDGTGMPDNRVLRLVGLAEENLNNFLVIDLPKKTAEGHTNEDDIDNINWGNVKYRKLTFPDFCTNLDFNVNHVNSGTNSYICGRIWDNSTSATGNTGNVGINTTTPLWSATTAGFSPTATAGTVRTDGRVQMNALTAQPNNNGITEILGIRPNVNAPNMNEVVRIPYPTIPPVACTWSTVGNNDVFSSTRNTFIQTPVCQQGNSAAANNFIGTTGVTDNGNGSADLVFASQGRGFMRLTNDGGLFLSDFPQLYGAPRNPTAGNIKIGWNAGFTLRLNDPAGVFNAPNNSNIVVGHNAAASATIAGSNIIVGNGAGNNTAAPIANQNLGTLNVIIGTGAASNMNTLPGTNPNNGNSLFGTENVIVGAASGQNITEGTGNTFVGSRSGQANTTANYNTMVGSSAGLLNTSGASNTFVGNRAGSNNTTGFSNTFIGNMAGRNVGTVIGNPTIPNGNVYLGDRSGDGTYSGGVANIGVDNTCLGFGTGTGIRDGSQNTYIGSHTGARNYHGNNNTYLGFGVANGWGNDNIGSNNTFLGASAGNRYDVGDNNVFVGVNSGYHYGAPGTNSNSISIGNANEVTGDFAISIGTADPISPLSQRHTCAGNFAIAIGSNARATANNSVAIGMDANTAQSNAMVIGTAATTTPPTTPPIPAAPLKVGIGTSLPTARLHINCANDPRNPSTVLNTVTRSEVRFQNLLITPGCSANVPSMRALVIDNEGYVYQGNPVICCNGCRTPENNGDEESNTAKTDSLLKRIEALEQKLSLLEKDMDKCCTKTSGNAVEDFPMSRNITLYQNVPNPFTTGTEIKFFIPETVQRAALVIYDLNGREIRKIDINERNESAIKIQGKELAAGMYIYTLIADNKEVDSKRMILTGN